MSADAGDGGPRARLIELRRKLAILEKKFAGEQDPEKGPRPILERIAAKLDRVEATLAGAGSDDETRTANKQKRALEMAALRQRVDAVLARIAARTAG